MWQMVLHSFSPLICLADENENHLQMITDNKVHTGEVFDRSEQQEPEAAQSPKLLEDFMKSLTFTLAS